MKQKIILSSLLYNVYYTVYAPLSRAKYLYNSPLLPHTALLASARRVKQALPLSLVRTAVSLSPLDHEEVPPTSWNHHRRHNSRPMDYEPNEHAEHRHVCKKVVPAIQHSASRDRVVQLNATQNDHHNRNVCLKFNVPTSGEPTASPATSAVMFAACLERRGISSRKLQRTRSSPTTDYTSHPSLRRATVVRKLRKGNL